MLVALETKIYVSEFLEEYYMILRNAMIGMVLYVSY